MLTDALSVLALISLVELILPLRGKKTVYIVLNVVLSFMMFASAVYNVHFGSIPTYTALAGIGQVNQVRASITALLEPEHFLFFLDLVVLLIIWAVKKSVHVQEEDCISVENVLTRHYMLRGD